MLTPSIYLTRRRPIIEKWTGEEDDDMEAEFDNIDTNEGGMILFQVKTHYNKVLKFLKLY